MECASTPCTACYRAARQELPLGLWRDYGQVVSQVRKMFGAGAEVDACITVATLEEPVS